MNKLVKTIVKYYEIIYEMGGEYMFTADALCGQYRQTVQEKNNKFSFSFLLDICRKYAELRRIVKSEKVEEIIKNNIIKDKNICNGKAIVKDTRLTVENIVDAILEIRDIEELMKNFPSITKEEQILAALAYDIKHASFIRLLFR